MWGAELLRDGIDGLTRNPLRTALTTLGIIFGVAAVLAMVSIGRGAEIEAQEFVDRVGLRNVVIRALDLNGDPAELTELQQRSRGLSTSDARVLEETLPHLEAVGVRRDLERTEDFLPKDDQEAPLVAGVDRQYLEALGLELVSGRTFDTDESARGLRRALLGRGTAIRLFGRDDVVGEQVRIERIWFTVIGVVRQPLGDGQNEIEDFELADHNRTIFLPLRSVLERFELAEDKAEASELLVVASSADQVRPMADMSRRTLERLHAGVRDYDVVVPVELLAQSRATQSLFNLVMSLIAGISLLVGGIGIMNVMLSAVVERTREIGLRRAVGATRRDIMWLFLVESAVVSCCGGVLGIGAGFVSARLIAQATGWTTSLTPGAILLAAGISAAVGIIFGLLPARRAAALDPVTALRSQ